MSTRAIALASFSLATVLLTAACGSAGPNTPAPAGAGASSAPQATTAAASDTGTAARVGDTESVVL